MTGHETWMGLAEVRPEEIAAAWNAWRARHGGQLGPGPAFAEAIAAAFECRAAFCRAKAKAETAT